MRLIRLGVLAVALVLVFAQPAAAIGPGNSGAHAPLYYLSLGDSLAAGEQPGLDGVGRMTSEGYADQLYAMAKGWYPNLELVKLGCIGGEKTSTMIDGGVCAYDHGSQLDEALSFLHAHGKFVAFITIDIGINDFPCQNNQDCIAAGLGTIEDYLPDILGALREAAGPATPIVGMTYYDPLLGYWLMGDPATAQLSAQLFHGINQVLAGVYGAAAMPVADVEGAFATLDFEPDHYVTLAPGLSVPLSVARICQLTWVCSPPPQGPNNHANAAGYGVMAGAFATALGH